MTDKWNQKDERQYEEILSSLKEKGRDLEKAKEIAAKTVNKYRRKAKRTINRITQGTGNPNTMLEDRSKQEVYNIAKKMEIDGRSKMKKSELIAAIRDKR